MTVRILHGDCRTVLPTLPDASVQCCVTSPPYFGLRDYGCDGQIGLEPTPDAYVAEMVAVFREVRRVLRADGTCWLNIGDSYANIGASGPQGASGARASRTFTASGMKKGLGDCKPKDLMMIPAMIALALRADGWYLRSDTIWHKPNPMPESVNDRPTSAHEHVFLLTKSASYYYDQEAIREPASEFLSTTGKRSPRAKSGGAFPKEQENGACRSGGIGRSGTAYVGTNDRNARNVWTIATQPYSGAHFATMPPELADRCIKAGTKPGDMVLDPFGGAGTTAMCADRLNRHATIIELNPAYAAIATDRVSDDAGMFASVSA